jgi:hypothetical protein
MFTRNSRNIDSLTPGLAKTLLPRERAPFPTGLDFNGPYNYFKLINSLE